MSWTSSSRRRPSASRPKLVRTTPARTQSVFQTPRQREINTKRRGELAELEFVLKAANRGFGVARPYGDSERYDVILDARELLPRRRIGKASVGNASVGKSSAGKTSAGNTSAADARMRSASQLRPKTPCHSDQSRSECDGVVEQPCASAAASKRQNAEKPSKRTPRRRSREIPTFPPDPSPPLWRVQVKCSTQLFEGFYRVNAHRRLNGRAVPYLPGEIHFFAVYIIPEDTWYIIPLHATCGVTSLLFRRRADRRPGLYDAYREAWHLLRPK